MGAQVGSWSLGEGSKCHPLRKLVLRDIPQFERNTVPARSLHLFEFPRRMEKGGEREDADPFVPPTDPHLAPLEPPPAKGLFPANHPSGHGLSREGKVRQRERQEEPDSLTKPSADAASVTHSDARTRSHSRQLMQKSKGGVCVYED